MSEENKISPPPDGPLMSGTIQQAAAVPMREVVVRSRRLAVGLDTNLNLFYTGLISLGLAASYYAYNAKVEEALHLYLGELILIVAAIPCLLWARRKDSAFPVFEVFMLTCANTYAVPLLTGHQGLALYDDTVITRAAIAVLVFQAAAIITFIKVHARPKATRFWAEEMISEENSRFLAYGMVLTTAYTITAAFFDLFPHDLDGPMRAVFFGIGIACTFITCRKWGQGTLKRPDRIFFSINMVLQVIVLTSSLFLVNSISIIVLAILGYVSGSRRLPWAILIPMVPILGLLHNGKAEMRVKYWEEGKKQLTLSELPEFYSEWVKFGWPSAEKTESNATAKLLERTSLFHMMCLVVSITPEKQDYLYGKTYTHIPGQLVPRFFWPDKPFAHISTYLLCVYYGLQTEEETKKTTIGFGMLTEAFANFGFAGMFTLGVLIGFSLKKLSTWGAESPTLSYGGLLLVLLMAWSFQVELTMSIWISSLFQAVIAVLGVPLGLRSFGLGE